MSRIGIPLALASAVLFGASTPLAKLLLGQIDPWMMAGLLYLGAGLGMARGRRWVCRRSRRRCAGPICPGSAWSSWPAASAGRCC